MGGLRILAARTPVKCRTGRGTGRKGTPMNVLGYIRVSTNEQAENGVSLAAQRHRIREYCQANGYKCVEILEDDGYSGKDSPAPGAPTPPGRAGG